MRAVCHEQETARLEVAPHLFAIAGQYFCRAPFPASRRDFLLTRLRDYFNHLVNQITVITSRVTTARRSSDAATARMAILNAAEKVFARSGLAGARTEAIAAAAGVNKALLFYYFRSKQGLYEAIVEEHLRDFNKRALAVLDADAPAGKLLLDYVSLHFDFISRRHQSAPLFQQFMMGGGKRTGQLIRKYFKPRSEAVERLLNRGVRSGEFRRTDARHTAVSIVSLVIFYFSAAPVLELLGHSNAYGAAKLRSRKRAVLDFIRHALFIHPEEH